MLVDLNEAARLTGLSRREIAVLLQTQELQFEKDGDHKGIRRESLRGRGGYEPPPAPVGQDNVFVDGIPDEPWTLEPHLRSHLVSLNEQDRAVRIAVLSQQYAAFRDYLRDNPLPPVFRKPTRLPARPRPTPRQPPPHLPTPKTPPYTPPPSPPPVQPTIPQVAQSMPRVSASSGLWIAALIAVGVFVSQVPRILTGGPARDISEINAGVMPRLPPVPVTPQLTPEVTHSAPYTGKTAGTSWPCKRPKFNPAVKWYDENTCTLHSKDQLTLVPKASHPAPPSKVETAWY